MAKLYVGNPTRQTARVYYRMDFTREGEMINGSQKNANWQDIPAGQQVLLGNTDLPMEAVKDIVEQLNVYGMRGVVDVKQGNLPRMTTVPYVFNIDAAIPSSVLQTVFDHNRGVQMALGKDLRQKAAIAGSEIVAQATQENPKVFELEIEQEGENEYDTPAVAEGYRVEQIPTENTPPRRGRPRKAA